MTLLDRRSVPRRVRELVEQRLGKMTVVRFHEGQGPALTVTARADFGDVFLKVVDLSRPRSEISRIAIKVQPYLPDTAPRLLWHVEQWPWLIMCFEHIVGTPACLSPGSADLAKVAAALTGLSCVKCPHLPVLPIEKRWAPFALPSALAALRGDVLVHTDLVPGNILIGTRVRFVDWAWPSVGAPWLDTALMIPTLIQSGHTAGSAERWAEQVPAYRAASPQALDACATVLAAFARHRGSVAYRSSVEMWRSHRVG